MIQRIQKYKLPLIVGAFILLFAAVLIPLLREGEKPAEVNTERFVEFDGKLVWHLTADKILVDPDSGKVYFVKPTGTFVSDDGVQLTITADQGIVDRNGKTIELKAPLEAHTDQGDSLQTDGSVYYNMDTREITGGKVVITRADQTDLSADSFTANAALNAVTLTGHARITKGE